jgi:hypothetical protein
VAAGVSAETASALRGLIDRLSAGRYAPDPPGPEVRRNTIQALDRVLERVDREAPAAGAIAGVRPAGLALVLLAAVGTTGVGAQEPAGVPVGSDGDAQVFAVGVRAYDAERYAEAVGAFQLYVQDQPQDAAGWYNLGTAYYRGGLDGYAIWSWLKVLALEPRHGDARHNLRVAGAAPELVARASPPLRLRSAEFFLLAAVAWMVAGITGTLGVARRGRRLALVAGAAFLLAAALAAGGWASTRPRAILIVVREASVRAGPNLRADPVTQLEPGTGLTRVERRGDWVRVRTDDVDGWVESTATEPL